jgi:hypothetical protein
VFLLKTKSKTLLKYRVNAENQNGDANKTEESKEEPDMWEETFKTHTDSKPHGICASLLLF